MIPTTLAAWGTLAAASGVTEPGLAPATNICTVAYGSVSFDPAQGGSGIQLAKRELVMAKKQGGGKLLPTNRSGDFLLVRSAR
jgi:hypothetical protein